MTCRSSRRLLFLGLATLVLAAGCPVDQYEVELKPDGEGMQRRLKVRRVDDGREVAFDEKKIAAIAKAYREPAPKQTTRIPPFSGRFADRMPDDVGGASWYLRLSSPMGSASGYTERFRGTLDQLALLEESNARVDRGLDHLVAWLKTEVEGEPYADKAVAALNVKARRDLKNLILYMNAGSLPVDDKNAPHTSWVRIGAFLVEQGYCQPKDIPGLMRNLGDNKWWAQHAMRLLATQAGLPADQPLPTRLQRLTQPDVLDASLRKYAEATPEHQKRLADWEVEKKSKPDAERPNPLAVFEVWDFQLGSSPDDLDLQLHTSVEPYETNGKWSAEEKRATWKTKIPGANKEWPVVCYAFWSEPDAKYQQARFGRVLLKDKALADYCTWYSGLTAGERGEWDALIASEPSGQALIGRILQFRFRGDPPMEKPMKPKEETEKKTPPPSLADTPRRLFEGALQEEKRTKR